MTSHCAGPNQPGVFLFRFKKSFPGLNVRIENHLAWIRKHAASGKCATTKVLKEKGKSKKRKSTKKRKRRRKKKKKKPNNKSRKGKKKKKKTKKCQIT